MTQVVHYLLAVVVAMVLATTSGVNGQACVPFPGSPGTEHKCDAFLVGRNVLLTTSFAQADASAGAVVGLFNALLPFECREIAVQLTCQSLFPVCDITSTLEVRPPCRSVCETMWLECLPYLASANVTYLLPDCDMIQTVNGVGLPVFPPDGIYPCLPVHTASDVAYTDGDCPYPLTFYPPSFTKENPFGACQMGCPFLIFGSEERFWGSVAAMYIASVPSMVCSFVMILTWLLIPSKRRYPAVLIMWLSVSTLGVSTALNLGVLVGGPKRTICTWDDDPIAVDMDNAGRNNGQGVVCILQAIGQYYFGLACNFWWLAITANIFLMICFGKRDWLRRWTRWIHYGFHVFCWGLPLVGLIIVLSMKKLGSTGINPFCGLLYDADDSWEDWVFYSAPILACVTTGTILMVISIIKFVIVQLRYDKSRVSELTHLFRLIALVIAVWLNNVFYLALRIYLEDNFDKAYGSIEEQALCSLTTRTDCPSSAPLNYPFYIVSLIASISTGVCVFLTMCTTKSTLMLWVNLGGALLHPRTFFTHVRMVVSSHSSGSASTMEKTATASIPGLEEDHNNL